MKEVRGTTAALRRMLKAGDPLYAYLNTADWGPAIATWSRLTGVRNIPGTPLREGTSDGTGYLPIVGQVYREEETDMAKDYTDGGPTEAFRDDGSDREEGPKEVGKELLWATAPDLPVPGNLYDRFSSIPTTEDQKELYRLRTDPASAVPGGSGEDAYHTMIDSLEWPLYPDASDLARAIHEAGQEQAVYFNRPGSVVSFEFLEERDRKYLIAVARAVIGRWDGLRKLLADRRDG